MTHLLDTHAVVWAFEGGASLGKASERILRSGTPATLAISDFTLLELALLIQRKRIVCRIGLTEFLEQVERQFTVLPVSGAIAATAVALGLEHGDPFDRVIVATAQLSGLTLVTKDRRITESKLVPVVW